MDVSFSRALWLVNDLSLLVLPLPSPPPPPPTYIHNVVVVAVIVVSPPHTIVERMCAQSTLQHNAIRYISFFFNWKQRMRILVPLKRERLCVHGLVSHLFAAWFVLQLSRSLFVHILSNWINWVYEVRSTLLPLIRSTRLLAHSDGWMDRIRSRHCTHNMLDDSHFSIFIRVCINRVYITLRHTKSFAYRLHSQPLCVYSFYHYNSSFFGSIRLRVAQLL